MEGMFKVKILQEVYLHPNEKCTVCLGKGWVLLVRHDLDATQFREVRPCPKCVKQVVKIDEEKRKE